MLKKEIFTKNLSEITSGMKQKKIAAIMGCTEGTMSKYLNPEKKDFPPVDRLYNIAEHFNVSIDWLVGVQTQKKKSSQLSLRDICLSIVELYNSSHFNFETITKDELCGEQYFSGELASYKHCKNTYLGIYFSDWFFADPENPGLDFDIYGNKNSNSEQINIFLDRFKKITDMYFEGNLNKEMYDRLLKSYLDDVPNDKYFNTDYFLL